MKTLLLLGLLLITSKAVFGHAIPVGPHDCSPQIIQDLRSKVIFYLESNRRRVSAINFAGKIIWSSEIIPESYKDFRYISNIGFIRPGGGGPFENKPEDVIVITTVGGGVGTDYINKKTGVLEPGEVL